MYSFKYKTIIVNIKKMQTREKMQPRYPIKLRKGKDIRTIKME